MAKRLAILNYLFIFDPSNTGFTSASQFEKFFTDFCAAYQIDSQVVETAGSGVKAFYLESLEPLQALSNTQNQGKVQSPQQILNKMREPVTTDKQERFNKGRFLKTKGYTKR